MKSDTISIFSPSICHEVMGLDAKIFIFWMMSFKPTKTKLTKKNFKNQLRNVQEYTVHQIYFQEYEYTRQNGCPKMSPPQPPWNLWIGYVTEQNGLCRYKNGHRFWNRKVILGYPNGPIWSHDPVRAENFLCQILTVAEVRDKQEIDFTCHYLRQQYWKHFSFYKWRPAPTDKSTRQEERQSCNCMQSTIQMNWKVDSSSETPPSPKNVALWAYWFRLCKALKRGPSWTSDKSCEINFSCSIMQSMWLFLMRNRKLIKQKL